MEEFERRAADINSTITAYERVIAYRAGKSMPMSTALIEPQHDSELGRREQPSLSPHVSVGEWRKKLRGLTHIEALTRIAGENDGVVRVTDAKQILLDSGLTKGKLRNVSSHIYHLLSRSEKFERVEPGVFRLVEPIGDDLRVLGRSASSSQLSDNEFLIVESHRMTPKT
jgi:hypothetical protein